MEWTLRWYRGALSGGGRSVRAIPKGWDGQLSIERGNNGAYAISLQAYAALRTVFFSVNDI